MVALLLAASLAPPLDLAPGAEAAHSTVSNGPSLPTGRQWTSAVWDGQVAYIFGGWNGTASLDDILRYEPASGAVETMAARLPSPRHATSAVWTGRYAYIFGGTGPGGALADVLRYDPVLDAVALMAGKLPSPRSETSAAWSGTRAYVVGGWSGEVVRYDPATGAVDVPAGLPPGRNPYEEWNWGGFACDNRHNAPAALWMNGALYVFGGQFSFCRPACGCSWSLSSQAVHRYDPVTGSVTTEGFLPTPVYAASAVWSGSHAYVLGGLWQGGRLGQGFIWLSEVTRYEPGTGLSRQMAPPLPAAGGGSSAVWVGPYLDAFWDSRVVRYTPNRPPVIGTAPQVSAECSAGRATVRLDASASSDPEGDALSFAWSALGIVFDSPSTPTPAASFPLGATRVSLTVNDGDFTASASVDVLVIDTLPPAIDLLRPADGHAYLLDEVKVSHGKHHGQPVPALAVGPLTVIARASDQCGLVSVGFRASDGEQALDADPQGNSSFLLDPAVPFAGNMTLQATALDLGGHETADSITYLHVATDPMPIAMRACSFLFRASDCADLRAFLDSVLAGVRPPQGAEDLCRLLLGGTICDEFTGK